MAFSPETLVAASSRSGDQCECTSGVCGDHAGRCQQRIHKGQWEAWKKVNGGDESLDNCELICRYCADLRRAATET
jgi:hypothetical protein